MKKKERQSYAQHAGTCKHHQANVLSNKMIHYEKSRYASPSYERLRWWYMNKSNARKRQCQVYYRSSLHNACQTDYKKLKSQFWDAARWEHAG